MMDLLLTVRDLMPEEFTFDPKTKALADKLGLAIRAHNDRAQEYAATREALLAVPPNKFTAKHVEQARSLGGERVELANAQLALLTRIRDEWLPVVREARIVAHETAIQARTAKSQEVTDKLKGIGFDDVTFALPKHPAIAALAGIEADRYRRVHYDGDRKMLADEIAEVEAALAGLVADATRRL